VTEELTLSLPVRLESLDELNEGIEAFSTRHALPPQAIFDLRLVLEELFVNVLNHAFADRGTAPPVRLRFSLDESGAVSVGIEDEGIPFNPLSRVTEARADPTGPAGGFGIPLVVSKTRNLNYARIGGRLNSLTFLLKSAPSRETDAP
jgi:serine/threonine-protein kinase RsbW